MKHHRHTFTLLLAGLFLLTGVQPARAQTPNPDAVVRAVLFYSPTCGHCQYVITETLPPLFEKYGNQLQMVGIDVSQADGQALFITVIQMFSLDRGPVPFLVVGDKYLTGSVDIPEQFPGLVDRYLAQGGVDWPAIPGFLERMTAAQGTQQAQPSSTPMPNMPLQSASTLAENTPIPSPLPSATPGSFILTGETDISLADRLALDPVGNGLAIIVLAGMLACLGWGGWFLITKPGHRLSGISIWIVPALCILGMIVAGYLAYVEVTNTEAVCGPVGDCNTVQQSQYARLFGILPIGGLGLIGYVMILAAWAIQQFRQGAGGKLADYGALGMLIMAVLGTLFSVYLTFLEPFVIGATCAWCLASAIVITILMLLSLAPGRHAFRNLIEKR
jgi:uncharacterized membrane protein/thiol-disulfide isomerase/thioredoxin